MMMTEKILFILSVLVPFWSFYYTLYAYHVREKADAAKLVHEIEKNESFEENNFYGVKMPDEVDLELDRISNRYKKKARIGCLITIVLLLITFILHVYYFKIINI